MTRCNTCHFTNPSEAHFCGGCGRRLGDEPRAERRQICVMFCDVVGSTPLAGRLDPEDLAEVIREYQVAATAAIEDWGGHVAQYLGDGVMAYFGFPRAHEDDAVRAVHAGLQIVQDLETVNERLVQRQVRLAVRIAIHSGPVVAGRVGADRVPDMALGQTPNVAARLQAIADPDTVVMSRELCDLLGDRFVCTSLGPHSLAGIDAPIEVIRAIEARDELHAARPFERPARGLVGRETELAVLRDGFARARRGSGNTVVLEGEAGIGKSHLVQTLQNEVEADVASWTTIGCSAHLTTSPFAPVTGMLARVFGFARGDTPSERLTKLERGVRALAPAMMDELWLLGELLGAPASERHPPRDLSPEKRRERILSMLLTLVTASAGKRALVIVVEDLHWADPSTRDFVGRLVEAVPALGCFLILTARPGDTPPWGGSAPPTVRLERMAEGDVHRLATVVAGHKRLPKAVLRQIVDRADGIPLFVEELTKAVLESRALREHDDAYELVGDLGEWSIPSTLRGLLTARLDRLPHAARVAQVGAVLGREFSYELIRAVGSFEEPTLSQALEALTDAELLLQRGTGPGATFVFRHALIQEAAYDLLLHRRRRALHERVAQTFVEQFPHRVEREPEVVARHYLEAGRAETAAPFWLQAAEHAMARSATIEAQTHLEAGLGILGQLPETPDRSRLELSFQMLLGNALLATRGFASPEASRAFLRAEDLCRRLGETPEQFWARMGLFVFHLVSGDLRRADPTAERLVELALASGDADLVVSARSALGVARFYVGAFPAAIELKRSAAANLRPGDRAMRDKLGWELEVSIGDFSAMILWHLGRPEEARAAAQRALDVARRTDHAFTLAHALVFAGCELQHFLRDPAAVAAGAAELCMLCEERGFPIWHLQGAIFRAWAQIHSEPPGAEEASVIAEGMSQALALYATTGSRLAQPYLSSLWAEVLERLGRPHDALDVVTEALALTTETGDVMWQAELHRLRGHLLLVSASERDVADSRVVAEAAFRDALSVARAQGSLALELRAAVHLGRLWLRAGRAEAARALVRPVYERFPAGAATVDLQDARTVLDAAGDAATVGPLNQAD